MLSGPPASRHISADTLWVSHGLLWHATSLLLLDSVLAASLVATVHQACDEPAPQSRTAAAEASWILTPNVGSRMITPRRLNDGENAHEEVMAVWRKLI
jgi:hypothetical protein